MRRTSIILLLLGLVILYVLQIKMAADLNVVSIQYDGIEKRIAKLSADNALLRQQVLYESSYQAIEVKAKAMGFIESTGRDYVAY